MYHIYVLYLCIISMYYMHGNTDDENSVKNKKMRLVALIIFLIEWTQMELISRGKQWKY